jgi:hypothetical protein
MPNKSLSIYSTEEFRREDSFQLVIEIAKNHLACIVSKGNKKAIAAFELFTFDEDEGKKFDELLANISKQSKLLSSEASSVSVYINNEYCVPVPVFVFNKEIAVEYLRVVYGEIVFSNVQFEHLPLEPGIINVYPVEYDCFNWLRQKFKKFTFHHTYSNIMRGILSIPDASSELITVRFYNTFMIVAVMKDANFHLIQTYHFETPEDVLYYLLNITQQLELFNESLTVRISGMISLEYNLYRELITYFKEVIVDKDDETHLKLDVGEYPLHYFTPFFKLAQ